MKLSDRYRQNYCDIYPQKISKPSLNLSSKIYVVFLASLATMVVGYFA